MRASEASTREVRLAKPSIRAAAKVMAEVAERDRFVGVIRRLPVVNRSKRLVGILSLGTSQPPRGRTRQMTRLKECPSQGGRIANRITGGLARQLCGDCARPSVR